MLSLNLFIFLFFGFSLYVLGNLKNMHGIYSLIAALLIIMIGLFGAIDGMDFQCGYVENSTTTNITTVTDTYCKDNIHATLWVFVIITGVMMFLKEGSEVIGVRKK